MEIFTTPRFQRSFKKLSPQLQEDAIQSISLFRINPQDQALRVHKLSVGELWAFSIDFKNRIIFQFLQKGKVLLINIGDHSIYRKIR